MRNLTRPGAPFRIRLTDALRRWDCSSPQGAGSCFVTATVDVFRVAPGPWGVEGRKRGRVREGRHGRGSRADHRRQIYRGAVETAGEIGHSTIAEDGPVCRCGNRRSLEPRNRATVAETFHRSRSV